MALRTHLFIKNISLSLQKLCQYNKNLMKHQTKINATANKLIKITKELKL